MFKRTFTDHQLAAYLTREGGLDTYTTIDSPAINEYWKGETLIAIVVFDNSQMTREIYTYNTK